MTRTLQVRRQRIPEHRRKQQVAQTIAGVLVGVCGMFLVQHFGLGEGWHVAAALLGLRIASREFLMDCLKIVREVLNLLPGGKAPPSPEPDARVDDERGD